MRGYGRGQRAIDLGHPDMNYVDAEDVLQVPCTVSPDDRVNIRNLSLRNCCLRGSRQRRGGLR